jgi:hypothetical protein
MNTKLRALWQRALRRVGVAGLAGLALLAAGVALALWAPHLKREATQLQLRSKAEQQAAASMPAKPVQLTARQQLMALTEGFPLPGQNADDLEQVFQAAQRNHVTLARGEYQMSADRDAAFVTYAATFPVREPYSNLKDFAADVLQSLPHAAIEDLRMERTDAGASVLDARIRITFVYRAS